MEFNKLQRFGNDPKIPTELPIYQKTIIEAMRNGSFIWQDDFDKVTYHIRIGKKIHTLIEPLICTLIFRNLISDIDYSLTEYGEKVKLI